MLGQSYDAKVDLWSVGVILYGKHILVLVFHCTEAGFCIMCQMPCIAADGELGGSCYNRTAEVK